MNSIKIRSVFSFFIGLYFCCFNAFSQGVALVLATVNKVISQREGTENTIKRGDSLFAGDTILTKAGSGAQIKYADGTLVTIEENSHYQILSFNPKENVSLKMKLTTGTIQYQSSKKHQGVIQTPVVALSILGTKLTVIVADCKNVGNIRDNLTIPAAAPSTINCKTYVDVKEGLVKGGQQLIGPGVTFSSGVFGSNQSFTPGPIPSQINNLVSTENFIENTITNNIQTVNNTIIDNLTTTSIMDSVALQSELAALTITCP